MISNQAMYNLFRPDLVLFLASDEARYVTGTQMRVDPGYCEK